LFVNNVLEEVKNNATTVIMDPEGSRVMEKVLRIATHDSLFSFFSLIFGRLEELCFHKNGSHVIQTLLCLTPDIIEEELMGGISVNGTEGNKDREEDGTKPQSTQELLLDMCALMMDGWVNMAFDQYGSHLFRVMINVLTGRKPDTLSRSRSSTQYNTEKNNTFDFGKKGKKKGKGFQGSKDTEISTDPLDEALQEVRKVPAGFGLVIGRIMEALLLQLSDDDFAAMTVDPVASPLLQLLMVVHEKNESLLAQIVSRFFTSAERSNVTIDGAEAKLVATEKKEDNKAKTKGRDFVQGLITHPIGSHVMQRLLQVAPVITHTLLYNEYFRRNLVNLCNHSIANFVVASLVKGVKSPTIFGLIVDELAGVADLLLSKTSPPPGLSSRVELVLRPSSFFS